MTPIEFHYDWRILADEIEALANKSFNPAEIDWFLNRSQDQIVRSFLNLNNVRQQGFEMDQKRIDDLKGILVKYPEQPILTPTQVDPGLYELPLSSLRYKYLQYIRGNVTTLDGNCETKAGLVQVQHDDLNDALVDPFSKPTRNEVIINFGRSSEGEGQSIYFYSDLGHILTKVSIEYLKHPNRIYLGTYADRDGNLLPQSNTDLSESIHSQIVNRAVHLASGVMKDQNLYQAMLNEIAKEE